MGPESTGGGGSTGGPERTIPAKVVVMKVSRKNAECFTNSREPGPAAWRLAETGLEGANGGTARTVSDIGVFSMLEARVWEVHHSSLSRLHTNLSTENS